ncbi:MAG: hypothetical protein ACPGLY_12665 [Rubripirellula sp.]
MSFALLSTLVVLLGVLGLATALWLAQRLRVQHREVEVLSTLFWEAAIEETRARVFVRRFRHWLAWILLVAIASLLWMLLAQPTRSPADGTKHVVLLDWSVDDAEQRQADLRLAIERAETLPTTAREIVAVGSHLETLLAAGEPIEMAAIRASHPESQAVARSPQGMRWAIEALSYRASPESPLAMHLVGNVEVERAYLNALRNDLTIYRIPRDANASQTQLLTLGVADSVSGRWGMVDVAIGFPLDQVFNAASVRITVDDQPVAQSLQRQSESEFQLLDVVADGGTLRVEVDDKIIGEMTLPTRELIRVAIDESVPETLRELIRLDKACQIVSSDAEVRVGSGADSNFRLSTEDESAFLIESDHEDPKAALSELINELALQQIDAMAIAEESGRVIDVQVAAADRRSIAIWSNLFTPTFDFAESRACPIFVARSIRWLANQPAMVPWAEQGERLPVASPEFDRASGASAATEDGRQIQTARLSQPIAKAADLLDSPAAGLFSRVGLMTWLGLIVSTLLAGEWMLYQRGRMP